MIDFFKIIIDFSWGILSLEFPLSSGVNVAIWQIFGFFILVGFFAKKIMSMSENGGKK